MNARMKRRMAAVAGIIVIVVIAAFALVAGSTSAKVASVAEAAGGSLGSQKVEVTGVVMDNSYEIDGNGVLTFSIRDEGTDLADAASGKEPTLKVSYDKGVSATFGNGVSAICTGKIDDSGTLVATELVTKCPSKYENASDALSVSSLLGYGNSMVGKTVKIEGILGRSGLADVSKSTRFVLEDEASGKSLKVKFTGAVPDDAQEPGTKLVLQGSLEQDGGFLATSVAKEA